METASKNARKTSVFILGMAPSHINDLYMVHTAFLKQGFVQLVKVFQNLLLLDLEKLSALSIDP